MSNIEMASLVVGFFLPLGIAVAQQAKWSNGLRAIVAFLMCAAAALVTTSVAGDLGGKTFVESGLLILVTSISTYKMFWQPTGIAPKIEVLTSPKS